MQMIWSLIVLGAALTLSVGEYQPLYTWISGLNPYYGCSVLFFFKCPVCPFLPTNIVLSCCGRETRTHALHVLTCVTFPVAESYAVRDLHERLAHGRQLKIYLSKSADKLEFTPADDPGRVSVYWEKGGLRWGPGPGLSSALAFSP